MLLRFIKNWTLPLAMLAGTAGYFFFARIPLLAPAKPCLNGLIALLTPALIFAQLLLTFCKVEVHELKTEGMARLAVAVSDGFVSGCCGFAGVLPHERDVSGSL